MAMNKSKRNKNQLRFWLIVGLLLVLPAGLLILYRLSSSSQFDRRVKALAAEGYPVSLDDLEKTYRLPEGVQNAADTYIEAFSYYQPGTVEENEFLPISGSYESPDDVPPFPPEVITAIETHINNNLKTLELLDKAAKIEHCLWPRTREDIFLWNDNTSEIKRKIMLLCERQLYLAHKGQTDKLP